MHRLLGLLIASTYTIPSYKQQHTNSPKAATFMNLQHIVLMQQLQPDLPLPFAYR
jgi:hypothetical protein